MAHPIEEVGKPCPTCKRPIVLHEFHGMDPFTGCSEFCEQATDKEKEGFKSAKPGDFCVFPCAECGTPIEGEWEPNVKYGCLCTRCYPRVQLRDRTELLKQARDMLNALPSPALGPIKQLVAQIDETLK